MLETKQWQAKNVNILTTSLNFQQNYFDDLKQNYFQICFQQNFRPFSKIVLSVYFFYWIHQNSN